MHMQPLPRSMPLHVSPGVPEAGFARLMEESVRKDVFMATVAHELRNLISPLSCALELLELGCMDPKSVQRVLPVARRQVHHMSHLIDDLLDIARMLKDDVMLEAAPTSLRQVALDTVEACSPLFSSQLLNADLGSDELTVMGDPLRLTQVLTNLLHNAAKFTPAGGRVDVHASRVGEHAVLRVSDTGIGMDPEQLESIFDLFAQETQDPRLRQDGLGIGLALVRKLVQLHGGTVEATSGGCGCGSTFTVRLPILRSA